MSFRLIPDLSGEGEILADPKIKISQSFTPSK